MLYLRGFLWCLKTRDLHILSFVYIRSGVGSYFQTWPKAGLSCGPNLVRQWLFSAKKLSSADWRWPAGCMFPLLVRSWVQIKSDFQSSPNKWKKCDFFFIESKVLFAVKKHCQSIVHPFPNKTNIFSSINFCCRNLGEKQTLFERTRLIKSQRLAPSPTKSN